MSVLFFYRRIFLVRHSYRKISLALLLISTAWFLAFSITCLCMCRPIQALFSPVPGECNDWAPFLFVMLITSALIDLAILILPIRFVFTLQLPNRIRLAIAGIFALGGFVMFTSVLRLLYLYRGDSYDQVPPTNTRQPDLYSTSQLWTTIHTSTAILCASLPTYRSFGTSVSKSTDRLYHRCAEAFRSFFVRGNKKDDLEQGPSRLHGQEHKLSVRLT
jgi:hypothetical protein